MKQIKETPKSFEHDHIFRVNVACAPMADWVKANLKYSTVLETIKVGPLCIPFAQRVSVCSRFVMNLPPLPLRWTRLKRICKKPKVPSLFA